MLLQPFSIPAAYEKWGKYPFKSVLDDQQQLKTKVSYGIYPTKYVILNTRHIQIMTIRLYWVPTPFWKSAIICNHFAIQLRHKDE